MLNINFDVWVDTDGHFWFDLKIYTLASTSHRLETETVLFALLRVMNDSGVFLLKLGVQFLQLLLAKMFQTFQSLNITKTMLILILLLNFSCNVTTNCTNSWHSLRLLQLQSDNNTAVNTLITNQSTVADRAFGENTIQVNIKWRTFKFDIQK